MYSKDLVLIIVILWPYSELKKPPSLFEELHDLLIVHEAYLKRLELIKLSSSTLEATTNFTYHKNHSAPKMYNHKNPNKKSQQRNHCSTPTCKLYNQFDHIAKWCLKPCTIDAIVYYTTTTGQEKKWLMHSTTSHNTPSDLSNLTIHLEYDGQDEVVISDDTSLPVTHVGSMCLPSPICIFTLDDSLSAPFIQKNLISIHSFMKVNCVSVEFFDLYFLEKDLITGP